MNEYLDLAWTVITFISVVVTAATVVAKKTKSTKDDEFLSKIHPWIDAIANLKKPEK